MKQFRFSPIQNKEQMMKAIIHIHLTCHKLCKQSLGRYLPVAGNVGVFCHYDEEYKFLTKLREELTDSSASVYGKYFRLHKSVVIPGKGNISETTYSYLYIRKPDLSKTQVGDIDFYMEQKKYFELKKSLNEGKVIKGVRTMSHRPDLELIELYNSEEDACGYIGHKKWQ